MRLADLEKKRQPYVFVLREKVIINRKIVWVNLAPTSKYLTVGANCVEYGVQQLPIKHNGKLSGPGERLLIKDFRQFRGLERPETGTALYPISQTFMDQIQGKARVKIVKSGSNFRLELTPIETTDENPCILLSQKHLIREGKHRYFKMAENHARFSWSSGTYFGERAEKIFVFMTDSEHLVRIEEFDMIKSKYCVCVISSSRP